MSDHDLTMSFEIERALREFQTINAPEGLSEGDKTRLKEAYLRNYFTPNAQDLLREKLKKKKQPMPTGKSAKNGGAPDTAARPPAQSRADSRRASRMSWRPRIFKPVPDVLQTANPRSFLLLSSTAPPPGFIFSQNSLNPSTLRCGITTNRLIYDRKNNDRAYLCCALAILWMVFSPFLAPQLRFRVPRSASQPPGTPNPTSATP